ncbi:MAG: sugar phosphate isomerase/epimerase family protein [Endomicrobiia bacterium]
MEIGISTGIFHKENIFNHLETIKNSGFEFIELWADMAHFNYHDKFEIEKLKNALNDLSLKPVSMHAPFSYELDLSNPDETKRKQAVFETLKTAEAIKLLNGDIVVTHPATKPFANISDKKEKEIRTTQSKKSFYEVLQETEKLGIKLAIENQLPHIYGNEPETLLDLLSIKKGNFIGICFDTSHASFSKNLTVREFLKKLGKNVITLHVSDSNKKMDEHLPPGWGLIDWEEFITTLREINYSGIFMLEILKEIPGKTIQETFVAAKEFFKKFL